jgi:hypothetical protein
MIFKFVIIIFLFKFIYYILKYKLFDFNYIFKLLYNLNLAKYFFI